ncbi:MAG: GNAT family N-acetyltransferase [Microbacterium sp.]
MMDAFPLETARLTLDQPTAADVDDIARFCAEPVFDRFMVTPWPYERQHAVGFIEEYVPNGWAQNTEWTWAIREHGS